MEVDGTLLLHVAHPLVEIQMLDAGGVERRGAAHYAVHLVTLLEKELRQEASILSRDAGDERYFHLGLDIRLVKFFA